MIMIIAFTGAGISKESGIDTFQDRPGIRSKLTRQFASEHPRAYRNVMRDFVNMVKDKEPNDAHIALAEYDIPVITMNIDGLHEKANTKHLIRLHGTLPTEEELPNCSLLRDKPVLYGDLAPNYTKALDLMDKLKSGDIFLVIGASTYTSFSQIIRTYAISKGAKVVEIQDNASVKVRKILEEYMKCGV